MEEKKCNCTTECTCGCQEDKECTCDDNCTCGEECSCDDSCSCGEESNCNDTCNCSEEKKCDSGNCTCEKENKKEKKKHDKHHEDKNTEKIKFLEESNNKLEQEVLTAKAELINYRKRKDEEVSRLLKFCNEDLIKQILPILDNFERAIKLDDDNLEDEVSKFLEGFKMIYCNMNNVMANFDVKAIDGANKPFDPNYHNAIMLEHKDGVEPGMVIEVLQKGYIYKDKVVRPAMVKVSE